MTANTADEENYGVDRPSDLKHVDIGRTSSIEVGDIVPPRNDAGYRRALHARQIMMLAFGGGIGTGLWVGTGTALARAGTAGTSISYLIVVYIVYAVYMSLGEMTTYKPLNGGFIRQALDYTDEALAFAQGIGYWYNWVMIIPAEVTAAISVISYWPNNVPIAVWVSIMVALMIAVNFLVVKWYGEVEFWISLLKIIAIVAMIFFLFLMTSGAFPATKGPIEFRYWKNGMAFKNGIKGISQALIQAAFSIGGGDIIAVTAGEAADPRRSIKRAMQPLFWRMASFFVLNIWLVGMCVSPNNPDLLNASGTMASPFVLAIRDAGYYWLADLLNALILLSVVSCGITSVYIASRSLSNCSELGMMPRCFAKKDRGGRPILSLVVTLVIGCGLCYLNLSNTGIIVYDWFSSLVGIQGFIMYMIIFASHIRFRRGLQAQGIDYKTLPLRDRLAPYNQMFCMVLMVFILAAEFYLSLYPFGEPGPSVENFFASYLTLPVYIVAYFGYKLWFKTKWISVSEMDFSGAKYWDEQDRILAEEERMNPNLRKRSVFKKVVQATLGDN